MDQARPERREANTRRMGPFMLGEQLGAGGMGMVFRATYVKTGQQVAVKLLPAELLDNERAKARFQRELEILTRLKHPNIVRCFGGGTQGNRLFYAMELVEGGSLSALLKQRQRLSWETTVDYGRQISQALEHAHEAGIIHRDVKPANVLLGRDGKLKLSDFGLARDTAATALTVQGRALGTFAYMAPEIIRGEPPVSYKADLYSLGCMLFEMLTGQPPFRANSPAEMFYQHLDTPAPRVSTLALDCPIWLESLIAQLLDKDPSKRPFDAKAVTRALVEIEDKVLSQSSVAGHSLSGSPSLLSVERDVGEIRKLIASRSPKPKRKGPLHEQAWFLAACLVVLGGLVTWAVWPANEESLYREAMALMESKDEAEWQRARRDYLEPMLRRFPQGEHAAWARQSLDEIDMHVAETRFRNHVRFGRPPTSEGERLFAEGWRYEQFGDRVTALEKYEGLLEVLPETDEHRPFRNLARRQIAAIDAGGDAAQMRQQLLTDSLDRAEKLYRDGDVLGARKIWESIVNLYAANRELAPLVDRAQARLRGEGDGAAEREE